MDAQKTHLIALLIYRLIAIAVICWVAVMLKTAWVLWAMLFVGVEIKYDNKKGD